MLLSADIHTAYGLNIRPCRDQRQWEKVDGPQVQPPLYEKKLAGLQNPGRSNHMKFKARMGPKFLSMELQSTAVTV